MSLNQRLCTAFGIAGAMLAGCSIQFGPGDGNGNDNGDPVQAVTIRFENATTMAAVDVEFYATNDEIDTLPDDLFVSGNLFKENIGVAGSGLIQPLMFDQIEFPCTNDLVIGTTGGTFLDNESGEDLGTGTQIVAQETLLGLCGGTVTLLYFREGSEYRTRLLIE